MPAEGFYDVCLSFKKMNHANMWEQKLFFCQHYTVYISTLHDHSVKTKETGNSRGKLHVFVYAD